MQHAYRTVELAPDERAIVERLLGRMLSSDEAVEIVARPLNRTADESGSSLHRSAGSAGTLGVPADLEAELRAQAQAEAVSPELYLRRMIEREITARQNAPRSSASLLGALAEYGPAPSAEEIDENRREMFRNFAREDQW